MSDPVSTWVADGTPSAEPVTTSTPETPVETAAPAESGQPRDESGRFTPKDSAAPVAESTTEATAQQIHDFIEALNGEEPFKVPKSLRFPLKLGHPRDSAWKLDETVEYKSLDELLKDGMRGSDYARKTREITGLRRDFEAQRAEFDREKTRFAAREQYLKEKEDEIRGVMVDETKAAAFIEHLKQYENNPNYRKHVDDALAKRETDAQLAVYQERETNEVIQRAATQAREWIEQTATEFPDVDAERVRQIYAQRLSAGQANLDPAEVKAIFKAEADYLSSSVSPLQAELATLKAQVERLTASQAAEKQNQTTQHAVNRAKTVPVATGAGSPAPGARPKPEPFHIRDLADRNAAWAKQRD